MYYYYLQFTISSTKMELYEKNNYNISEYDRYIVKGNKLYAPWYCYEEFLADTLDHANINPEEGENDAIFDMKDDFLLNKDGDVTDISLETLIGIHISCFHAQNWYHKLPNKLTFKSWLIKLSMEEINVILNLSSDKYSNSVKDQLIKKIDNIIVENNGNPIFAKSSHVSPKDLLCDDILVYNGVDKSTDLAIQVPFVPQFQPNQNILKLLVRNGEECINILHKSGRVRESIRSFARINKYVDSYIFLREYVKIIPENEYRCFIYKDKLRAISRYMEVDSDQFEVDKNSIRTRIVDFYRQVKKYIPWSECTMDIVITDTNDNTWNNLGIYIIEFNSFGADMSAGSCLYNWHIDHKVLYESKEVDIRI